MEPILMFISENWIIGVGLLLLATGIIIFLRLLSIQDEQQIVYEAMVVLNKIEDKGNNFARKEAMENANYALKLSRVNKKRNTMVMALTTFVGTVVVFSLSSFNTPSDLTIKALISIIAPLLASIWVYMKSFNKIRGEYLKLVINYEFDEIEVDIKTSKKKKEVVDPK